MKTSIKDAVCVSGPMVGQRHKSGVESELGHYFLGSDPKGSMLCRTQGGISRRQKEDSRGSFIYKIETGRRKEIDLVWTDSKGSQVPLLLVCPCFLAISCQVDF